MLMDALVCSGCGLLHDEGLKGMIMVVEELMSSLY